MIPLTDAVVTLPKDNPNPLLILGRVYRAIQQSNHPELAEEFIREATDDLLETCNRYVTVE